MISISPKVIEQLNFKSRLKVSPFTNLPPSKWGYFWSTFKFFLEVNIYNNIRSVGWFTIIFPLIFMPLVWFYMHDTSKYNDTHFFKSTLPCFDLKIYNGDVESQMLKIHCQPSIPNNKLKNKYSKFKCCMFCLCV
jgi:hypothetical protein